eukprot:214828_1
MFAYTCHANTFPIVNELKNCKISRINQIIFYTMMFCCILYCTVGFSGYFTYGSECESDLLVKYPKNSILIVIVRICLSIAVAFSYPLNIQPCRHCLSSLLFNVTNADLELSNVKFILITTCLAIGSLFIAMTVDDLGIVLGLVGSTGINLMIFILPGLFYINIEDETIKSDPLYKCKKYGAVLLIVMGVIMMPFSIVMQFV